MHAVIPAAVLLCWWIPSEITAGNRQDMSNTEKIKIIHKALRSQLKEKKLDLKAEDIFRQIGSKIPVKNPDDARKSSNEELQEKEKAELQKFEKEARLRYPAYLIGDTLKLSGNSESVTGKYNKRTSRGIWIGMRSIPWTDISPECAALFHYKTLMNLRAQYVQTQFNLLYRKYKIQTDGKWMDAGEYICQRVKTCLATIEEQSRIHDLIQILIYVCCIVLAGGIAAAIGKFSKGNIAMFFGGFLGIFIGLFIGTQIIYVIKAQKTDKAVAAVLETIVDPKEEAEKTTGKYKFYKIEEIQTVRNVK